MTTEFISINDIDLVIISENPLSDDEKDSSSEGPVGVRTDT